MGRGAVMRSIRRCISSIRGLLGEAMVPGQKTLLEYRYNTEFFFARRLFFFLEYSLSIRLVFVELLLLLARDLAHLLNHYIGGITK